MNYTARISVFGGRDIDEQTYADAVEIGIQPEYLFLAAGILMNKPMLTLLR